MSVANCEAEAGPGILKGEKDAGRAMKCTEFDLLLLGRLVQDLVLHLLILVADVLEVWHSELLDRA